MAAPHGRIEPGQPLESAISARAWNRAQDAADIVLGAGAGMGAAPAAGYEPGRNIILARNATGVDVPRWGVMRIEGMEVDPASGDDARRSFEGMPIVSGAKPDATATAKFVIAVEPIAANKVGRVCAAGIIQAKVSFSSANHSRARPKNNTVGHLESADDGPAKILWSAGTSGEQWALVRFDEAGGGPIRVGKVTGDWPIGTCTAVQVWESIVSDSQCLPLEGVGPQGVAESIANVANLSFDVLAGSWVVVGQAANGQWYLIDAGIEGSCRQTIGGEDIAKWAGWDGAKEQLLGHDGNGCLKWFDVSDCEEPSPGETS